MNKTNKAEISVLLTEEELKGLCCFLGKARICEIPDAYSNSIITAYKKLKAARHKTEGFVDDCRF